VKQHPSVLPGIEIVEVLADHEDRWREPQSLLFGVGPILLKDAAVSRWRVASERHDDSARVAKIAGEPLKFVPHGLRQSPLGFNIVFEQQEE
jgi:hypothetical protein